MDDDRKSHKIEGIEGEHVAKRRKKDNEVRKGKNGEDLPGRESGVEMHDSGGEA